MNKDKKYISFPLRNHAEEEHEGNYFRKGKMQQLRIPYNSDGKKKRNTLPNKQNVKECVTIRTVLQEIYI